MKFLIVALSLASAAGTGVAIAADTGASTRIVQQTGETVQAKRCRYGSYRDANGKRRCRRPSGSHSGSHSG